MFSLPREHSYLAIDYVKQIILYCFVGLGFPFHKRNTEIYCGLEITTFNAVIFVFQSVVAPLNHAYAPCLSTYDGMHFTERTLCQAAGQLSSTISFWSLLMLPCRGHECKCKNNKHQRMCPQHGWAKIYNIWSTSATSVSSELPAFPHGGRVNKSEGAGWVRYHAEADNHHPQQVSLRDISVLSKNITQVMIYCRCERMGVFWNYS